MASHLRPLEKLFTKIPCFWKTDFLKFDCLQFSKEAFLRGFKLVEFMPTLTCNNTPIKSTIHVISIAGVFQKYVFSFDVGVIKKVPYLTNM